MELLAFNGIPDGVFLDYFLNRITEEQFFKSFKAPPAAIKQFKLDNLFNVLKYSLFNEITNEAGAHFILLQGQTVKKVIKIKNQFKQTISIEDILPNNIIASFHLNPLTGQKENLEVYALRNNISPLTKLDLIPALTDLNNNLEAETELTIFTISKNLQDDIVSSLLIDAFQYCQNGNYRYSLIAAHNAYELSAKRYFFNYGKSLKLNAQAKRFFENFDRENISAITTKYLPLVTSITGKPMPPETIIDKIIILTKLRNNLNHSIKTTNKKELDDVYNSVLASYFMCKYFELQIPSKDYPTESFYSTVPQNNSSTENTPVISIFK